jgi:thiamine pyrophosphate-dependent acetolactate synthase large subunit-like protein
MMRPSIKECIAVERAEDIIPCIDRAFKVSMEGRRGVVWVDIPKDIQG